MDDSVILKENAAVIPKPLCKWYVEKLQDGHQGCVKMEVRAKDTMYWPRVCNDTSRTESMPAKNASSLIQKMNAWS